MTTDHYKIENNDKISYCDDKGVVAKSDRFLNCFIPARSLSNSKTRINKLPQEVILHNKLKSVFKNVLLEPSIERRLIANVLVASRFVDIATINDYQNPAERTTVFNGNSHHDTYIGVPHRVNDPMGHENPIVMPFRYLPTESCFVCLAQDTIIDRETDEHYIIIKVHERRLIRDFNLRASHQYYKFSYLSQ